MSAPKLARIPAITRDSDRIEAASKEFATTPRGLTLNQVLVDWRATVNGTRTLRPGDEIPEGEPKRYLNDRGYVRLRWLVGRAQYVEAYEHRVVMGLPPADIEVHHVNGVKTDNRPENLRCMSKVDHARLHAVTTPQQYKGKPRRPLSEYPRCGVGDCDRAGQCLSNKLCLMHYKRWKRHGSTDKPQRGRAA